MYFGLKDSAATFSVPVLTNQRLRLWRPLWRLFQTQMHFSPTRWPEISASTFPDPTAAQIPGSDFHFLTSRRVLEALVVFLSALRWLFVTRWRAGTSTLQKSAAGHFQAWLQFFKAQRRFSSTPRTPSRLGVDFSWSNLTYFCSWWGFSHLGLAVTSPDSMETFWDSKATSWRYGVLSRFGRTFPYSAVTSFPVVYSSKESH